MRALIYGGRDWDDQAAMNAALDRLHREHDFHLVINGGQVSRRGGELYGADWQAAVWAMRNRIPVRYWHANWHGEGKAAGPLRNQRMLDEGKPQLGIEFPGGAGTRDMRRRLIAAGLLVIRAMETVEAA